MTNESTNPYLLASEDMTTLNLIDVLNTEDRMLESSHWSTINDILNGNEITDNHKLILVRKPKNLVEYCLQYPHITINKVKRTILHYYDIGK
jgi:hypothetical protein